MRRTRLFVMVLAAALAASPVGVASAARRGKIPGLGVPLGTPVTLRTSPDNNIVNGVATAAARLGLGPVDVVRFSPDCSSLAGRVVVCRDITLQQGNVTRAATEVGYGFCVVRLDPRVGGAAVGTNIVTRALKKCLAR